MKISEIRDKMRSFPPEVRFLTNLTMGKKIILLTALGLLLGVGVFSSLGMRAANEATETMLQDRLTTAGLVADYLNESLGRALSELNNTAQKISVDSPQNYLETQVQELEATYSRLSILTNSVYLINGQGQILWSKPSNLGVTGTNISAISAGQIAMGRDGISGLVSAPVTNTPVILVFSPLAKSQEGDGMLVIAFDVAQSGISGFVKPIRLGQTGYVEIVDQNGVVIIRTDPGPKLAPFEKSDHSGRFAALISAGEPTRGVCHTCHEPEQTVARRDVLAFMPLSKAPWGVIIRQSEQEALAPTNRLRQSLLLFGVGMVTVALLFVGITTRDIGGRIRLLTFASQRIAEGDLLTPVPTSGKDEVGMLASTLDGMRVKLETSYNELEKKTKELSSLLSVSQVLTSTLNLSSLLEAVVTKAVDIIPGADSGALLLQDKKKGGISAQCVIGLEMGNMSQFVFPTAAVPSKNELSDLVNKGQKDTIESAIDAFLNTDVLRSKIKSTIHAEVVHTNEYVGSLIMLCFRDARAFSESDRHLLEAIADYIAIAIEKARLSEEAEQARALHEADRLRSQFISSVSHELRTPLTLIKGYSTSLLRQDVSWDKEAEKEFLQVIDDKTDELRDLIDKILQSAKLEAGALKLEKEPMLIPQLARRVVDDLTLRGRKHKFTLDFAPAFPVIEADIRCIEGVMRNLVENAIKYSPESSEIKISGEAKDGKVIVAVKDQGAGILPEHRNKIFERFYRVDNQSTRGIPGSGLGLFISKGHIEAHGGRVWVESIVGKGSTFYFSLPLDRSGDGKQESV